MRVEVPVLQRFLADHRLAGRPSWWVAWLFISSLMVSFLACGGTAPAPSEPAADPTESLRPLAERGVVPPVARVVDYELDAHLDTAEHRIEGRVRLVWRNRTQRTVQTMPLHLYMNGFRAQDTAWMDGSRGRHRGQNQRAEAAWGYIDIERVAWVGQGQLRDDSEIDLEPVEPPRELDWAEDPEPTTMTVQLAQPVAPGEVVALELDFTTQLPGLIARTGWYDSFYAVAQWFPKVGVLDPERGWQAHTFHLHSEFYADFGNYRVRLDLPAEMVLGATGVRIAERFEGDRQRVEYRAEMVHDFTFMGDSQFVEHRTQHEGVQIRQLLRPGRLAQAEDHLEVLRSSLDSYQARYGPYPWSTLTVIHPPPGAGGAEGMEYPTLVTTSAAASLPDWVRSTVIDERMVGTFTTLHEFSHQYFQGMLASNEHRQPWLDEGLASLTNVLAMDDQHEENAWVFWLLGHPLAIRDGMSLALRGIAELDPMDQPASDFSPVLGTFGTTSYMKTAIAMLTLRRLVGAEPFDAALSLYAERFRFRHPRGDDLQATFVEQLGSCAALADHEPSAETCLDLPGFFHQMRQETVLADFAVRSVRHRWRAGTAGWHRGPDGELVGGEPPIQLEIELDELPDEQIESAVAVVRRGGFRLPLEVLVEFTDGTSEQLLWNGRGKYKTFLFAGRRVRSAQIDPQRKLLLESRLLDNRRVAAGSRESDSLSGSVEDLSEALSLALLAGFGS